ncbi:MAG: undecaprenyl-phosphate glucose phosphotransferase [Chitinophagales bacterium]|nr:undecaprenyl-phosphate glucose phosphotransferase [Chitinophagales bacterium]MDW8393503.1 undecaprenyl-phosphate glucose phosphotransferase [Chitinophagales bacterium]
MFREKFRAFALLSLAGDLTILLLSFLSAYLIIWGHFRPNFDIFFLKVSAALVGCWVIVVLVLRVYATDVMEQFERALSRHIQAIILHALLIALTTLLIRDFAVNRILFILGYALFAAFDILFRIGMLFIIKRERESGRNTYKVIVLGANTMGKKIFEILTDYRGYGYQPVGIFDDQPSENGITVKGTLEEAKQFALKEGVDQIFCALPLREKEKITSLLRFAESNLIRFKLVPDFSAFHNRNIRVDFYGFYPVISLQQEPLANIFNRILKRAFDVIFSLLVIALVLWWLVPLVALLIKLDSKGPVFYIQNRSGRNYETFRCFKFRTMKVTEADSEYRQATKEDPRVTRVGRFLRKYNIDELPQFFNVLLGDMSVVGPRPHPIKLNEMYRTMMERYMTRHLAKPGITGLAQVRGFRGETANVEDMQKRVEADVFYIENWNFFMDIKIILLTVLNMLRGEKNAY